MPEDTKMHSWADEIDDGDAASNLPAPTETVNGSTKVVTEYSINDDGKKIKIVRTYRKEVKMVSKAVARRKALAKFGISRNDRPGPDPATTIVSEEIFMQFLANKDESEKDADEKSILDTLKDSNKGVVKCRICKEDHWTTLCPYKETLGNLRESLAGTEKTDDPDKLGDLLSASGLSVSTSVANMGPGGSSSGGKYVPPSRRDGGRIGGGEMMPDRGAKRMEDALAIRVSNLSENARETDLQELFKPFGSIARVYMAKDRATGVCKGFAFINYHKKEDAAKAIKALNGYGYDHLILSVEWARPSGS